MPGPDRCTTSPVPHPLPQTLHDVLDEVGGVFQADTESEHTTSTECRACTPPVCCEDPHRDAIQRHIRVPVWTDRADTLPASPRGRAFHTAPAVPTSRTWWRARLGRRWPVGGRRSQGRSGLIQRNSVNRAKSVSAEQIATPYSMASAARWASGIALADR